MKAALIRNLFTQFVNEESKTADDRTISRLNAAQSLFNDLSDEQVEKFAELLNSIN